MRIKVIEESLPLDKVYNILLKVIKQKNSNYLKSYHTKTHLLLILLNTKRMLLIIRVSKDDKFNRTYLSILTLNSKYLDGDNLKRNGDNSSFTIISDLFELLKNPNKKGLDYHLMKIPGIKLKENNTIFKFKNIETRIINKLFNVLSNKFNYSDNISKFPFSITQIDGSWIYWERLYYPFVRLIEKRINKIKNSTIKTFRNYDFALSRDYFPRIFDLIILERNKIEKFFEEENHPFIKKEREIKLFNQDESEDLSMFNLSMTFLYCNKKFKPLKLLELLKLMNEVKNYSKKLKLRIKRCDKIKPQMIIISFFGYQPKTLDYLRKHIYHEVDYIIPIFVLPSIKNSVWHNLKTYDGLSGTEKQTKEHLKKLINIGQKSYSSFNFKLSKARNAKDQYEELKEVEKIANDDYELMKKWSKILGINTKNRNQNVSYIRNEIPDSSITSINKAL
ncbi:MAG: hypothetical protein ACFFAK_04510 [Promethearchaeota archaeon]